MSPSSVSTSVFRASVYCFLSSCRDHRTPLGIAHTSRSAYVHALIAFTTRHGRVRDSCRTSSSSVSGTPLATVVYTLGCVSLVSVFSARRKRTLSYGSRLSSRAASVDTSFRARAAGLPRSTRWTRDQVVHTLSLASAIIIV